MRHRDNYPPAGRLPVEIRLSSRLYPNQISGGDSERDSMKIETVKSVIDDCFCGFSSVAFAPMQFFPNHNETLAGAIDRADIGYPGESDERFILRFYNAEGKGLLIVQLFLQPIECLRMRR